MFRVTARTLLELGSELISSDIIAFYELIKNGFDAKTTTGVEIYFNIVLRRNSYLSLRKRISGGGANLSELRDEVLKGLTIDAPIELLAKVRKSIESSSTKPELLSALEGAYKSSNIVISDTGSGMSLDDLENCFLVIGTASRKREVDLALRDQKKESPYLGEKGIGRLSAMRLGGRLKVETARKDDDRFNELEVDWSEFADLDLMLDQVQVNPRKGGAKPEPHWSGTKITIGDLAEDWTLQRVSYFAGNDFAKLTDPFLDQKQRRRIALFWNSVRQAIPWMDRILVDNAHARVSGQYVVTEGVPELRCTLEAIKLDFEHPKEVEHAVIPKHDLEGLLLGTSGEIYDAALINVGSFSFEAHWYNRRKLRSIDSTGTMKAVKELQEKWSGILLFRDGFRVFPYGEDKDDWLALDRKALRRSGYTLNKTQFVGRVCISRTENPQLVDQTNREGLRETPEQQVFLAIMQYVIQELLFHFMRDLEKRYKKNQKIDLSEAKTEVAKLQTRAKDALKRLRSLAPQVGREAIEDLEQTLFEFSEFAEQARLRISEVEQESRQMIEMAGVGLMVEVVAHELARVSENALENLDGLRGEKVSVEVRSKLESLRAQMKSLSKRVRILDPLSVAGRQRKELFSLGDLIKDTLSAHEAQFERHGIHLDLHIPNEVVRVNAVKGMVVQILENLISNSKYWLQMRRERDRTFKPTISIYVELVPTSIVFSDNGRGIAPEHCEKVFQAFFSLKEKSKRRGLGLFIARECAESNGGSLILDDEVDPETKRLHRFILQLP